MSRGSRYISAEERIEDDFGDKFTGKTGELVYAARIRGHSCWATMTKRSWERFGNGQLGLGLGQCYKRDEQGRLMKVGG
jgi:hypothetical protein